MARPSNTDERREQITRALQKVMAKEGYDGASIADVASAAGLATGLVHYHFKNKLEILLAVVKRIAEAHDSNLAHVLEKAEGDPIRELAAFIDFHLALESADPETLACWITVSGEALRESRVRRAFEGAMAGTVESLASIVRRGVEGKVFRCDDDESAACALVSAIQGYFVLSATVPSLIPRGSAARAVRRMATGLLSPTRPLPAPGRRS
jgi:TetR/AcrR family transcriptional repressor of bet genes